MSTNRPEVIPSGNLSLAWGEVFLKMIDETKASYAPVVISVTDFDENQLPRENAVIREAVDKALASFPKCFSVRKTALTIFPNDFWEFKKRPPHEEFATWFRDRVFPTLHRMDRHNRGGTYFQRLVAHSAEITDRKLAPPYVDQLAKILKIWGRKNSPRHSALQAAIFDPNRDHHLSAQSQFPCLQQVSFGYAPDGSIAVTGYYPSEYIFERGYGNYLGLCHLGRYMAVQLGRRISRMNCVVAHPLLSGGSGKGELAELATVVRREVDAANEAAEKEEG